MKQEVDSGGNYFLLCAACSSRLKGPQLQPFSYRDSSAKNSNLVIIRLMLTESRVRILSPQNVSGASRQYSQQLKQSLF